MTTLTTRITRAYRGEEDLAVIADLLNACEVVDHYDEGTSVEELREEFAEPESDPARDIRLWEDADGTLVGFAQLWHATVDDTVDNGLWWKVHPDHRDNGIEDEIMGWGEERAGEYGREQGKSAVLRAFARESSQERQRLYERHGMEIARYFWRMRRSLAEPFPQPQLPDGYTLNYVRGEADVEPWLAAFNQSFIDHYNHHDMTTPERLHRMSASYYVAEDDLIAIAPDGSVAAFCWCVVNPLENERSGRSEGWIELLGTRRGHRQIGLGRAMVLAGLDRLKARGIEWALLGVDGASPTGATRLYESVGFEKVLTSIAYSKRL